MSAGYGLKQVVRSEITKLFSLRSLYWTLLVTAAGTIAVTVLAVHGELHHDPQWYQGFDPTNQSLAGVLVVTLSVGILGAMAASGEYATGTIRSSLAATPRRQLFLVGKTIVLGGFVLIVSEALSFISFAVGQAILSSGGAPSAGLGQPGVLRAVGFSGLCLGSMGVLALGLGVLLRHTAGAIGAYVGVAILLPALLKPVPGNPGRYADRDPRQLCVRCRPPVGPGGAGRRTAVGPAVRSCGPRRRGAAAGPPRRMIRG